MLQLVLGIAGSGKTGRLLAEIKARAGQGRPSILLVPDQNSSSAEALVYRALGDGLSGLVEVVSFRTLAERIFKYGGGPTQPVLGDAGRVVYLRRALDAVGGELRTYARQRRSAAFCAGCADVLDEFKTAGATPAQIRDIGRAKQQPKLEELALIFEAYESVLENSALDPQDRLIHAAARAGCGYFAGKAVFVDNFDGFTAPEYRLVEGILQHAEALWVALCLNSMTERPSEAGLGLFSPVRSTAHTLRSLAAGLGVKEKPPVEIPVFDKPELGAPIAVNLFLALDEGPQSEAEKQGITLTDALDEWDELRRVAAEMRRLAQSGVPYSRMAVICRDIDAYEAAVRRVFGQFDIPYFTDAVSTLEYAAPVAFLRAGLGVLRQGISSPALLALLKTGLCGYSAESIAALENYVFTWSPKADDWRRPFDKNPEGLMGRESAWGKEQLALAEGLRADYLPKIEAFVKRGRGAVAAELSRQLFLLMQAFNAGENNDLLAAQLARKGRLAEADECHRGWDVTMGLLDSMASLLGAERLSPQEYDELLLLLVRSTDFGAVPQTLECAVFTAADRMRLDGPDYCFVIGLSEGDFPAQVGYSGLLTHADRDLLVEGGVDMPGSFMTRVLMEELVFYRALTTARKGLYLSWPARKGGAARSISAAVGRIRQAFAPPPLQPAAAQLAATPAAAFDLLGAVYRDNTPFAASLHAALAQSGDAERKLAMLQNVHNPGLFRVPDATVLHRLVGSSITLSATRAERYYECRFSYYMERVLKVRTLRKAELSPLESGTFVHYLLEKVMEEAGGQFAACTDDALWEMAQRHAAAFIAENLPGDSRRAAHLLGQIQAATGRLLCYLRDAAAQSDFVTDALELTIGDGPGAVPPLEVTLPGGETVRVVGQIDRVDVMHRDGKAYLCIVDYKTGSKKFDLTDVYCGLNMQMMIYLQTLLKNGGERYKNAVPAGVMYLTGDPAPASGSRDAAGQASFGLDGILLDKPEVLLGLDKAGEGMYLPVKHKAGRARAGRKLADMEKLGGIAQHVEKLFYEMADGVYKGDFAARPLVKGADNRPCRYCGYRAACRHEDGRLEQEVSAPPDAFEPQPGPCGQDAPKGGDGA